MRFAAFNKKEGLYVLAILALVLTSYHNTLGKGFVLDDVFLVYKNPVIKNWHNIYHIFAMDYWEHMGFKHTGLYRPLVMASFLAEFSISGLNPFLYHLDNVLLHFLCSVLVYLNLKLMLGEEDGTPLVAAMLFAVHPVHTEAVAWISGRAELMWSFFALLSALVFLKKPGRPAAVLLSSFLFLLALLSKEGAVILPVILAVYLVVFEKPAPGRSRTSQLFRRLYPYAVVFLFIYLPIRFAVLKAAGPAGEARMLGHDTGYEVFLTMCKAFSHYIRLSFLPFDLSMDYMFPAPETIFRFVVLLPILILAATAAFASRLLQYSRAVFFGIILFFTALLPVSNIIPIGIIMSERAMYIPVLGPCIILGAIISRACGGGLQSTGRRIAGLALALLLLMFTVNTATRNPFWSNDEEYLTYRVKLLKRRLAADRTYSYNYYLLANTYVKLGDYGPNALDNALEAAKIAPENPLTHSLLALIYSHNSMPEEALDEALKSLVINPENADTLNLAASILYTLQRDDEADTMLDKAFSIGPAKPDFYLTRCDILFKRGEKDKALLELQRGSALFPDDPSLYFKQGVLLGSEKRFDEAIEKLNMAAEFSDDDPDVCYLLGAAYAGKGDTKAAAAELKKALRINPGNKEALALLERINRIGARPVIAYVHRKHGNKKPFLRQRRGVSHLQGESGQTPSGCRPDLFVQLPPWHSVHREG
jgi:protein O-mannosyl-transferase